MKKTYFYITVCILLLSSCEGFIDKTPIDQIASEDFFTSEQNAEAGVIGAYRSLTSSFYYGQALLVIPEFAAGHMRHISDFPEYVEFENKDIRIDNPWVLNIWTAAYSTINASNNIIARVAVMDNISTEARREQFIAEAKFLRALSYFHLVRAWGDVPLLTEPTTSVAPQDIRVSRSPAEEVYAQIAVDLTEAAENLPESYATLDATKGRATTWAAIALLAKVQLYRGNYQQAATLSEQVINSGPFSLVADYPTIWTSGNTSEAIFELQFDEQAQNTFVNNANPGSRQEFFASTAASELFEPGDLRRNFTVNTLTNPDGSVIHYVGKYRQFNPPTQNVPILRVSEQLLIYAEASVRLTGTVGTEAYASLERIRTRAGLPTPAVASFTTESFLEAIQFEKRLEMMFESETWFDYTRTGRAITDLNTPNPERFLFPVPQLERDLNPALSQNAAYGN